MNSDELKLTIASGMDQLSDSSKKLLREQQSPFSDLGWFDSFTRYVCYALGTPQWLELSDSASTVALLPMIAQKSGRYHSLHSMTNYYSPYFDLITSGSEPKQLLARAIFDKARDFLSDYHIVEIVPIIYETAEYFRNSFPKTEWSSHLYVHSTNWRELNILNFPEYWSRRPSQLRQTIRRKGRKLENLKCQFRMYSAADCEAALAEFHRIYFKSWKRNEPFPAFIDALVLNNSSRNQLRLGLLHMNGKPVAAQLWLVSAKTRTAYIAKLAYDPNYSRFSPGTYLSYLMFEYVISHDQIDEIDYLTGDDPYKSQWMSTQRPLFGLEMFRARSFPGLLSQLKQHTRHFSRNLQSFFLTSR